MKKMVVAAITILFVGTMSAQMSDKFMGAMQPKVALVDSTRDLNSLKDLAAAFERIGDAEKTQWLPYYYAALCEVNAANIEMTSGGAVDMGNHSDKTDPAADKAEGWLNKAEALSKDNSEIFIVKKMIATLRLMGDPMNRYMTYGPEGAQALETAKKLNPDNPRIYVLEALDKYYTPEQFGGRKDEAKQLFEEALKKYGAFKPESAIHPNWGQGLVNAMLAQMK
jgi:hypothetical protein